MPKIKTYPCPTYKNPIRLSPSAPQARKQLKELAERIIANEKIFQRKGDKIPALPFYWPLGCRWFAGGNQFKQGSAIGVRSEPRTTSWL